MRKQLIILVVVVLLLTVGLSGCLKPEMSIQDLEMEIHDLVNLERQKNGLPPLSWDAQLADTARSHSQDMVKRSYFSHYNPEGQGPTERAIAAGYSCYKDYGYYYTEGIAENICQDNLLESGYEICFIPLNNWKDKNKLASSIVNNWMTSFGHRQNILDISYDREGIGVAISSNDVVYVTQNFC